MKSIFSYLTGKQISKACHAAQQHGDYRLSLLLSQVIGNSVTRNLVYKQLADWQELKVRLAPPYSVSSVLPRWFKLCDIFKEQFSESPSSTAFHYKV